MGILYNIGNFANLALQNQGLLALSLHFKANKMKQIAIEEKYSLSGYGFLVLVGGAEDRRGSKTVLKRIVEINNAKTVAIIPSASADPGGLLDDYTRSFKDLGIQNIKRLDIKTTADTNNPEYFEAIEQSDLIFFTGGDQVKLVDVFLGTALFEKIKEKFQRGATIAGTSAGAAAACDPIIFDGDYQGLAKGTIKYGRGFGLIQNITIDTHFTSRGRIGRLTQFLCSGISHKGIGIGEDTAIIIAPTNKFEVIGNDMVTIINTENVTFNNYHTIAENQPISIHGISVSFLQPGTIFDMRSWQVEALQDANFISDVMKKAYEFFS